MADPPIDTTKGNKITQSFKKHKVLWVVGGIVAIVLIYFMIRFYTNSQQNSANQQAAQNPSNGIIPSNNGGPVDVTGSQGPPGPPGPKGPRGPRGPKGGNPPPRHPKRPVRHSPAVSTPSIPTHMQPTHTSGLSHHSDTSHAVKSRETHPSRVAK